MKPFKILTKSIDALLEKSQLEGMIDQLCLQEPILQKTREIKGRKEVVAVSSYELAKELDEENSLRRNYEEVLKIYKTNSEIESLILSIYQTMRLHRRNKKVNESYETQ